MEQIKVMEIDMPISIKGFVKRTYEDGEFFTIVINSQLSNERKYFTIMHELRHINERDFSSSVPVDTIERERHL